MSSDDTGTRSSRTELKREVASLRSSLQAAEERLVRAHGLLEEAFARLSDESDELDELWERIAAELTTCAGSDTPCSRARSSGASIAEPAEKEE